MLEKLDEIKSKLAQLAPVINSFKSEAVQLKLVEIIFGEHHEDAPNDKRRLRERSPTEAASEAAR